MNLTKLWVTSYSYHDIQLRADFGRHSCGVALNGLDPEAVSDSLMKMASLIRSDPTLSGGGINDRGVDTLPRRCRRCNGLMKGGVAMQETLTGTPDFPGGAISTVSPGGPGRLIPCVKCVRCGYSLSIGSNTKEVGNG